MIINLLPYHSVIILCCLLSPLSLFSQQAPPPTSKSSDISKIGISPDRGTPHVIEIQPGKSSAKQGAALLLEHFKFSKNGDEVRSNQSTVTGDGFRVEQFKRYYQNIPVEHDRYNILSTEVGARAITAEHHEFDRAITANPSLTREEALNLAKNFVGANQYAWEQVEEDYLRYVWASEMVETIIQERDEVLPGGTLTIVDNYATDAYDPDLAWKFNLYASRPLSRAYVYVNAHSGEIMLNDRIIKHASTPTTVQTRYAGSREILVDLLSAGSNDPNSGLALTDSRTNAPAAGAMYVLRDDTRGDGLETYDANGAGGAPLSLPALYAQAKAFTDDDLNWTLTEHRRGGVMNEAENDDIAWDAHWGTQVVYDYWLEVHNRRSYDNNDIAIKSFLHYGVAYDNAFWNGTAMTYGDGSYQGGVQPGFAPLMSLDVCGHEIGHAICTFTSDLVYAKESGAMNEGFSDIWGAAIEAYAFRAIDPSLANIMAPFGIGEQIDENDNGIQYPDDGWTALRYMDTPNKAGDPDTYGGANWRNPDCDPSLANDQCGVHSNSGVLNKWFFLMTAGEDGTNDNGDAYSVVGLDFMVSERIAYGTELLLTPNATFAEARAASIAFVRSMSEAGGGPCNNYEVQVTNAWHGVGVGPEFACGVLAGFVEETSTVGELVTTSNACDASKVFRVEAAVAESGTVAVSGTATEGEDFTIDNPSYSVGAGGFGSHEFVINIIDDARIEGMETIVLTLDNSSVHTITLIDNDVQLMVGDGQVTLLDENTADSDWSTVTLLNGPNSFFKTAQGGTVSIEATGGATPVYDGNTAADDVILSTPLIDARGLRSLSLSFDWTAGGETDAPTDTEAGPDGTPNPTAVPLDYGNLAYSFDGAQWTDFTEFRTFNGVLLSVATGSFDEQLPDFLQGTQFFLGFRWRNDPLVGGPVSFSFTDPVMTAQATGIATTGTSIEDDLQGGDEIFFLTPAGDEVIARVDNTGASDYGCTTVSVETDGGGRTTMGDTGDYLSKTVTVSPTNNDPSGQYIISLYYTDAEIAAYLAESDNEMADVVVFKTTSPIADAASDEVELGDDVVQTTLPGGVVYTATFSSGFSSFALGVPAAAALPVELLSFTATTNGKAVTLDWVTTNEVDNDGFSVERALDQDNEFVPVGWVPAGRAGTAEQAYLLTDESVARGASYLYRLKQVDLDGAFTYSEIRQVTIGGEGAALDVFPNPTVDRIRIRMDGRALPAGTTLTLVDAMGKVVNSNPSSASGELDLTGLPSGVYLVRVRTTDGEISVRRVLKR